MAAHEDRDYAPKVNGISTINRGPKEQSIDPSYFVPEDTITRDVCVIGGGASGTYTAIRLQDSGKSVVVVEKRHQLGGHTETYKDPETGTTLNVGVMVFGHVEEVKKYFARFDIPLMTVAPSPGGLDYVDFKTGETVDYKFPSRQDIGAAMQAYGAQIYQHPEVQAGFALKYPVAEDLLMPFGQFVEKYSLQALIPTIFAICQGYVPFLEISALYVFKYFNAGLLNSLAQGFLKTERNDVGELYEKAAAHLGNDAVVNASILAIDRSSDSGPAKVVIETPKGRKLILAKKLVSTVPPMLENLRNWDLSPSEQSLFAKFYHSAFYAGVLKTGGLRGSSAINAADASRPYGIPSLPGIYSLRPSGKTDLVQAYYGSPHPLPEEQVRTEIVEAVKRIQKVRGVSTAKDPEFVSFVSHSPFNMMVSRNDIESGFYEKLYALQGQRHTFYNGAAFHAHDSSVLWSFTEELLPKILESL